MPLEDKLIYKICQKHRGIYCTYLAVKIGTNAPVIECHRKDAQFCISFDWNLYFRYIFSLYLSTWTYFLAKLITINWLLIISSIGHIFCFTPMKLSFNLIGNHNPNMVLMSFNCTSWHMNCSGPREERICGNRGTCSQ